MRDVPYLPSGGARRPYPPPERVRRARRRLAVAFVLVIVLLAGVGTAVVLYSHNQPTLDLGHHCGIIASYEVSPPRYTTSHADIEAAITCFAQHYGHCASASLVTERTGTDAGLESTMVIVPPTTEHEDMHRACGLVIQWNSSVDVRSDHSGQVFCSGLTSETNPQGGTVLTLFNCGSFGDILVPPGPG